MNAIPSPLILIGVGGAGVAMTRGVIRAYGPEIRALALDTDARSGAVGDIPFTLLGGNRLAGRGTGGEPSSARAAFQDNPALLDTALSGVRTAVIVTALGGGTGGGATSELLKHLHTLGIVTLLFATTPFAFEGEARLRAAKTATGPIGQNADVSVLLPLDELVANAGDNMQEALTRGVDTLASGVTLLWRLLERPGYIQLAPERLHRILMGCGRGHFATATASGPDRANAVLAALANHPLLQRFSRATPTVRTVLVGVLAGDDLRLSEVAAVSGGLSAAYGPTAALELGTVNDEPTFSGRLCVVLLILEENATTGAHAGTPLPVDHIHGSERALTQNTRFRDAEKTTWNDEDLDVPTFLRRQLTLDR